MLYSAVIQPLPLPFSQSGTFGSTLAVQSTRVFPASISTLPGDMRVKPRLILIGRSSFALRSLTYSPIYHSLDFVQQPSEQSFLHVHPICRLYQNGTVVTVDHIVGHFFAPLGGQAMQKYCAFGGLFH